MHTLTERERLPARYSASPESAAVISVLVHAVLQARQALDDVEAQMWPTTATWGLALWERKLGLPVRADLPEDVRRLTIRQKLTATGNTTAAVIEELGLTYTGYRCRVDITDAYTITLSLIGEAEGAVDLDLTKLYQVVEAIKPAHIKFLVSQLTWGDLEALGLTWGDLEAKGLTWGELERWTPINQGGLRKT